MLSLALSAALALPAPVVDEELTALTNKLAEASSYAFTSQTVSEGGGQFGRGGGFGGNRPVGEGEGEGGEPPAPPVVEGSYQKGLPMHLRLGDAEVFRDGDQVVHKDAEGKWQVMERGGMFGRGGGAGRGDRGGGEGGGEERRRRGGEGGAGGGQGGAGGQGQGGEGRGRRGGDDEQARTRMANMRASFSMSRVDAPHVKFSDFASKVESVAKKPGDKEGVTIWKGELNEAGTQAFASSRFGRGRGGFGGGRRGGGGQGGSGEGGPQMETTGDFTITVENGVITAASVEITMIGSFGERSFERTTTTNYTFGKMGEAKVTVPDEALALFEI